MTIASICRRDVITIDVGAPLRDAAALMRARHVGALVVTVQSMAQEQVVGVITDRDLAIEALARDLDAGEVTVGQVASQHLASVPADASFAGAVAVMAQAGVRRLIVTEPEGRVLGFVTADDLLDAMAAQLTELASALRSGIAREGVERPPIEATRPRPVFLPLGTPGMQQPVMAG